MMSSIIERDVYRIPLYTPPQAARIVAVPPTTLRNSAQGYSYDQNIGLPAALASERRTSGAFGPV